MEEREDVLPAAQQVSRARVQTVFNPIFIKRMEAGASQPLPFH